jgi:hypothetical protein
MIKNNNNKKKMLKKHLKNKIENDKELSFLNDPKILIPDQILTKEIENEKLTENNSSKKKNIC